MSAILFSKKMNAAPTSIVRMIHQYDPVLSASGMPVQDSRKDLISEGLYTLRRHSSGWRRVPLRSLSNTYRLRDVQPIFDEIINQVIINTVIPIS